MHEHNRDRKSNFVFVLGGLCKYKRNKSRLAAIWFRLFQEWILPNKSGHLMMLTQGSILNRDSIDVDKNKAEN